MTRDQLLKLKLVLEKIKNPDSYVQEAIAYVDRDIALRNRQSKDMKDNIYQGGYDY